MSDRRTRRTAQRERLRATVTEIDALLAGDEDEAEEQAARLLHRLLRSLRTGR